MATRAEPLFVLGSPRSGTTLVAGLLNRLSGVWLSKETAFVPHLYEASMDDLHQWDDARLAPLIESVNSYLEPGHWDPLATTAGARRFWAATGTTGYPGFVRYVWSLDEAPDGSVSTVVGDQSPHYVLAIPLLEHLFPDARYVHVVRDPRDVVASILPLPFGACSAGVAAADWNECIGGWWGAERRIDPDQRRELRYEDLVRDPAGALRTLAEFLHVPNEALDPDSPGADAHGLARRVPHHERLRQPIDDRAVGRHRRDLSIGDRALVEAITHNGLVTYGYDTGPFRPSPRLEENALLLTRERLRDLRRRAIAAGRRRWPPRT